MLAESLLQAQAYPCWSFIPSRSKRDAYCSFSIWEFSMRILVLNLNMRIFTKNPRWEWGVGVTFPWSVESNGNRRSPQAYYMKLLCMWGYIYEAFYIYPRLEILQIHHPPLIAQGPRSASCLPCCLVNAAGSCAAEGSRRRASGDECSVLLGEQLSHCHGDARSGHRQPHS